MTGHLERHLSRDPLRAVLNLFWNRICWDMGVFRWWGLSLRALSRLSAHRNYTSWLTSRRQRKQKKIRYLLVFKVKVQER